MFVLTFIPIRPAYFFAFLEWTATLDCTFFILCWYFCFVAFHACASAAQFGKTALDYAKTFRKLDVARLIEVRFVNTFISSASATVVIQSILSFVAISVHAMCERSISCDCFIRTLKLPVRSCLGSHSSVFFLKLRSAVDPSSGSRTHMCLRRRNNTGNTCVDDLETCMQCPIVYIGVCDYVCAISPYTAERVERMPLQLSAKSALFKAYIHTLL